MNANPSAVEPLAVSSPHKLHVLTLTPFYPTERDDASGCFVAEPLVALGESVTSTVFAVEPFYRTRSHPAASSPQAQWIRHCAIPGGMGLSTAGAFLYANILGKVRELHAKRKIDVIHAHAPLPCGHAAMLLRAELGIPYLVTVHGLDAFSTQQVKGLPGEWCRRISQRVYRNASRVICISGRVREQVLEGASGTCRTTVIYNGVDPELFSPADAEPQSLKIVSIGNLIPIKGHALLIQSVASLTSEFPALSLEIIGDGPERARLQQLASELRIADRVRFLGRQSRARVADALRRSTLFVLPSRYEGLGCVYLEAMASGRPVMACRGQGIAEVIQHGRNGLLVGGDNEHELALAISFLLRNEPLRRQMGFAARITILNRFTMDHQAENLATVYRECTP